MDCSVLTPDMLMLMDGGLISKCIVLKMECVGAGI